jgi:hypothetical protein
MSFALLFLILMVLWEASWFWMPGPPFFGRLVNNTFIWVLFALLGWNVFIPLVRP